MADEKPVVYILRGNDDYTIKKNIAQMVSHLGDASIADLNVTHLDGRTASEDDIRSAAFAMPFLAERRLVVLSNALARFTVRGARGQVEEEQEEAAAPATGSKTAAAKAARERFLKLLDGLPETTGLVMVVEDSLFKRKGVQDWDVTTEKHWLIKWARQARPRAMVVDCLLPTPEGMPEWIRKYAKSIGGQVTPQAAHLLVDYIGCDTQLAAQEVTKLLTFANFKRQVEEDDVMLLTSQTNQANVFAMVDALGERDGHRAIELLHSLLEETEPIELFGMIVRQFRLLLQAREVMDEGGGPNEVTQQLKLHPYVGDKLYKQARCMDTPTLEVIYHRLADVDLAMKTSQMPPDVALDTFVVEVTAL